MKHSLVIYEIVDAQGNSMAVAVNEGFNNAKMWGTDKDGKLQWFADDAWHCGGWAALHGFTVRTHTVEVDLLAHTVTKWDASDGLEQTRLLLGG